MHTTRAIAPVVVVLLLAVVGSYGAAIEPCDVTLEQLHTATVDAYDYRARCEKAYFTGPDCNMYWLKAGDLLRMETNFRICRKQTVDEFLEFLVGSNWDNGEIARQAQITRDVVELNAQQTQQVFTTQSEQTRDKVELEAETTQAVLTQVTNDQNAFTRANLTAEAQHTRATVSVEAEATRDTVETESASTRAEVASQEAQTRALVTQEAESTRATVQAEHASTRTHVSDEAESTRGTVEAESAATQAHVSDESANTRETLTNFIGAEGLESRTNISAEATLTRQLVSSTASDTQDLVISEAGNTRQTLTTVVHADGDTTRDAIATDGSATRQVVVDQSVATQNTIVYSSTNTNNVIQNGVNTLNNTIANLQNTQVSFVNLFVKLLIEASFTADASAGRIDLFQRYARDGGYFETMKAIVTEVVNFNKNAYNLGFTTTIGINNALASATSYENSGNLRRAWEQYRNAYNLAVTP